jgi:hypothetical protein
MQATAFAAADPALLRLVMPDAKVIAGLQVDHARNSMFGQFVLSHMQLDDPSFKKFVTDSGFDPRRDLTEIMMASNWDQTTPSTRWLVMGRGVFDLGKIAQVAEANGTTVANFEGVTIYTYITDPKLETQNGIAFFDGSNAVMGDVASVKAAIARKRSATPPTGKLMAKVRTLSAKNDFWFVTTVPVSEFASAMPDPNLGSALKGNLMQGITEASGGVRFGETVTISLQAITRSDKDAAALVDVFHFVASLLTMNRQSDATVNQLSETLDKMDVKSTANVMNMSLGIPEKQLEQLLQSFRQQSKAAAKEAPKEPKQ